MNKKLRALIGLIKTSTKAQIISGAVAVAVVGVGVGGYAMHSNSQAGNSNLEKQVGIAHQNKLSNEELVKMLEAMKNEASKLLDNADLDDVNKLIENAEWNINHNAIEKEKADEAYTGVITSLEELTEKINEVKIKNKSEVENKISELKEKVKNTELTNEIKNQIEEKIKGTETLLGKEEFRQAFELANEVEKLINPTTENTDKNNGETAENDGSSNNSGSVNNGGNSNNDSLPNNAGNSNNGSSANNGGNSNNSGSVNNGGSSNSGVSPNNGGGSNNSGTTTPKPEPQKPQYEAFTGFRYNIASEGRQNGYIGGENDFVSMYPGLSSKSTMASFNGEVNKAVGVLVQGAYQDKVKAKFLNKVYNEKYLITNVQIETFKVPVLYEDGNLVVDPYGELVKQGVENVPGGLFATVIGDYGHVSDDLNDYYFKCTVQFKEL